MVEFLSVLTFVLGAALGFSVYAALRLKNSLSASLDREAQIYEGFLDYPGHNPHPVLHVSKIGALLYANPASRDLLNEWKIKIDDKLPTHWREVIRQVQLSGRAQFLEMNGQDHWFSLNITPLPNGNVNIFGIDITSSKRKEKELNDRSNKDELTALPNQSFFKQHLTVEINHAKASSKKLAVLIIRLDDYTEIANTYGQDVSKGFLLQFCERIKPLAQGEDYLARLSDDEFGMIQTHAADPSSVSTFIQGLIETCSAKYSVQNIDIFITLSIGVALFPVDAQTSDDLIQNALLAVNRTSSTRNQFEFFQRGMIEQLQVKRGIIADLHKALANKEFELYYQPQINLRTMTLVGCEALIRWKHPEKGYISPFLFITAAEDTQLILPIGEWVIRQACMQVKKWQQQRFPRIPLIKMAINISARQLFQTDIVGLMKEILMQMKISPEYIELEITESALMQDMEKAITILKELKRLGLGIALDDFGTGYSSLSYLLQFPVDKLKIDRSFIKVIESEQQKSEMIKGIIDLGHSLNLTIVAEGAETKVQVRYLKDHRCDVVQGYYFAQPQPIEKFEELFRKEWTI